MMPDRAIYRTPTPGHPQVRENANQQPDVAPTRPAETEKEAKAAREEQTDAKAETRSREDTTFDQELADQYREAEASIGRSRSGGMSR
jgi:hypothetical protein